MMDLSLLIFSLETYRFCMKCIEFTTRTYNFKNLAVGSLIWSAKTGVNSSYFPQKFSKLNNIFDFKKIKTQLENFYGS